MIIDAHVAVDSRRYPIDKVLKTLEQSHVQQAVVFADARAEDLQHENGYVLRVARDHDLFPFLYVGGNPWTDTRPDILEVPDTISEYAGIRWHRWIGEGVDRHGEFDQDELDWAAHLMESAEFESLVSAAAHYGMPLIVEESLAVTVEFALRFPSIDIIVPHMGAHSGGEGNVLRALWDIPNVYLETSLTSVTEATLSRVSVERILFGSGYPYGDPEIELDKIEKLPISDESKERIFGDNMLSLLEGYSP